MTPQQAKKESCPEHEIGRYICPNTKSLVSLVRSCSLTEMEWPVNIEHCTSCGQKHVLLSEDVWHPPIYGFE